MSNNSAFGRAGALPTLILASATALTSPAQGAGHNEFTGFIGQQAYGDVPATSLVGISMVRHDERRYCSAAGGKRVVNMRDGEAYQALIDSGQSSLEAFDQTEFGETYVDPMDKEFSAPYFELLENDQRGFVRVQMGFPIQEGSAVLEVDGHEIHADVQYEAGGYTLKFADEFDFETLKEAYLTGVPVAVYAISELGTAVGHRFSNEVLGGEPGERHDLRADFEDCRANLADATIIAGQDVSIHVAPIDVPEAIREDLFYAIAGSQCLDRRGHDLEDAEIVSIEHVTGMTLPYQHALIAGDGELFVADYFMREANGTYHVSESRQQGFDHHVRNSCAGLVEIENDPLVFFEMPEPEPVVPSIVSYVLPPSPFDFDTPNGGGGTDIIIRNPDDPIVSIIDPHDPPHDPVVTPITPGEVAPIPINFGKYVAQMTNAFGEGGLGGTLALGGMIAGTYLAFGRRRREEGNEPAEINPVRA